MATTQNEHNGDGSDRRFPFTFPYIKEDDVKVSLRTSTADVNIIASTEYTFPSATEIQFNALSGAATTFQETTGAPKSGVTVRIFRDTDLETQRVTFFPGSSIRAQDLNDNTLQNLYASQERQGRAVDNTGGTLTGNLTLNNADIVFEGATADDFETTLTVVDPTADRTITLPNVTGTVVTTGDTNTVTGTMIGPDAINGDRIADDSINSEHYAAGSIDLEHMSDNSVDSDQYVDGSIDRVHLAADIIDGTKLADNAVDSEHYTDGSIDRVHLAADIIDGSKIADDSIDSEHIAADSIDSEHYAAGSVDSTALAADAIDGSKIADDSIDSEHYVDGSIDRVHLAADIVDGTKIADDSIGVEHIVDNAVQTAQINADAVTGAKIADDSIDSEHYVDGSIDTAHIGDQQVTAGKLATNAVTTAKINANAVTNAKLANDAVQKANIDGLTAEISDLNQIDGKTLVTSATWSSDTQFPSAANIDARITARIDPIDGFVAIADEDSFPATAPPEGTAVSISNAGGMVIGASASTTDASRAGSADLVTIQNIPANMQSQTVQDGIGMIVIATSTEHTYDFHRVIATNADVIALSGDINDFNNRYRVGSSNPTSDNDAGDLFFNTSTDKMLVRNGDNDAWEEVQSIGEFFIIPSSDFPTWNGSLNDISITNNAPANAEQIILSINGVIQEPVAGTDRPTDGFSLNGSTIQLSAAPATGSDAWGVIVGSTVNIGTPSANTVSEAKLQCSNDPTDGHVLTARSGNTGGLTWEALAASTLDAVTDAGATTDNNITVNEITSTPGVLQSGGSNNMTLKTSGNVQLESNVLIGDNLPTSIHHRLNEDGSAVFNDKGESVDFRIEGDTVESLFFVDGSTNRVGIGTNTPSDRFHVAGDTQLGNGNTVAFMASANNNTVKIGTNGHSTSFQINLPSAAPTADNRFLRAAGTGTTSPFNLEWAEGGGGGGATGGGSDQIFNENGTTVTTNYTVGTTLGATGACNAMSTGPITVNSGVTVTVNSGSRWVII